MNGVDLVEAAGYQIKRFDELPRHYQLAMIMYMAVDCEAWEVLGTLGKQRFGDIPALVIDEGQMLHEYSEKYGDVKFGIATIPVETMKAAILKCTEISEDFSTWDQYHHWYKTNHKVPNHSEVERWPSILDSDDGILQDGCHRFHSYVQAGHHDIPVIFYPEYHHLKSASEIGEAPKKMRRP